MGTDWSKCDLVEVDPGRVSGQPVLKGTRMPVDTIVDNHEYGVSIAGICEQFGIDQNIVRDVLIFADRQHGLVRDVG
jgi:uncharacterized protein (DUF433 family)